jgi:DNA-binding MarR family transcriptional regulator
MKKQDDRLIYRISRLSRFLVGYLSDELTRAGLPLTPVQSALLFLLMEKDGRKMNELAELLFVDNSALTRLADRLDKAGLITRRASGTDRRALLLHLTSKGRCLAEEAAGIVHAVNQRLVGELNASELVAFQNVMDRLEGLTKNK